MKKYSDGWYKIRARKEIKKCQGFGGSCPVAYHTFETVWGYDLKCNCGDSE